MQRITSFLWFDSKVEEAESFCNPVFENSNIVSVMWFGETGPGPEGTVMSVKLQVERQEFIELNGGPLFAFSPGITFFVDCKTQEEVGELLERLSEGGEKQKYGWPKDKSGLSFQIVHSSLGEMLQDKNPEKSKRVMDAMLQMDKIDIQGLKQAYERQ